MWYLSLGDMDKSIEHNTKALEIRPSFAMGHNNLAVALYHKGEKEMSMQHLREAINMGYPVNPDFIKKFEA